MIDCYKHRLFFVKAEVVISYIIHLGADHRYADDEQYRNHKLKYDQCISEKSPLVTEV